MECGGIEEKRAQIARQKKDKERLRGTEERQKEAGAGSPEHQLRELTPLSSPTAPLPCTTSKLGSQEL